jgi:hypothetical protein
VSLERAAWVTARQHIDRLPKLGGLIRSDDDAITFF